MLCRMVFLLEYVQHEMNFSPMVTAFALTTILSSCTSAKPEAMGNVRQELRPNVMMGQILVLPPKSS